MECRCAKLEDLTAIMPLIDEAKTYLRDQGIDQWQNDYPDQATIESDLQSGMGYILWLDNQIIGYTCISFEGEPSYQNLLGQWLSNYPYAVVHRLTISNDYKGRGLADKVLQFTENLCRQREIHSIKIDTDNDNTAMKHILAKNGFTYCGTINFDNSEKIAYEKLI